MSDFLDFLVGTLNVDDNVLFVVGSAIFFGIVSCFLNMLSGLFKRW